MHTRGPWSYEQIGVTDAGPNHEDVFDIGPCDSEGVMRKRIATVVGDDARLIAAAPELLSALRALHDNLAEYQRINNLGGYDNQDMRSARAAIAKATNA